jgi:hypothetical protein
MTSPDYYAFIDSLIPGHQAWLSVNLIPTGRQFFDHYVGDDLHTDGLLRQYEAWRMEHRYTQVRPWNGTEALGRVPDANIPSPGRVLPWLSGAGAGPYLDLRLSEVSTADSLQAAFGAGNVAALGAAIRAHWDAVRNFPTPGASEIHDDATALYSIRFWGFMKWASMLRDRLLGVTEQVAPIVYDADGVPLSDIEFMDAANRWHMIWHEGEIACSGATSEAANNPFAPLDSSFGQFCGRSGLPGESLRFHRDLLNTYDAWRQRAGMPVVQRWNPASLDHFHELVAYEESTLRQVLPEQPISNDFLTQYQIIKERVGHFNTLEALDEYLQIGLHTVEHDIPERTVTDIFDINTNIYSLRLIAWHRWIDYLWEVRQPRLDSLRVVTSDGIDYPGVLTIVRPMSNPGTIQPDKALTALTVDKRGTLNIIYNVRPETWGRPINLIFTAQVYRNSMDTTPVVGLDATTLTIDAVPQGVDSAPVEIPFSGVDEDGDGAFAWRNLAGDVIGFKNNRIRITARLVAVGNIPGSMGLDFQGGRFVVNGPNDRFDYLEHIDIVLVHESYPPQVSAVLNKSAFSLEEVIANAREEEEDLFGNAFNIFLQDPPEKPSAYGSFSIFADPARTVVSGICADIACAPQVEVMDESGTNNVDWFTVSLTDVWRANPSLPNHLSQQVVFCYSAIFNVASLEALLSNPGHIRHAYLRISAWDRAGNMITNVLSSPIKLFCNENL